MPAKAGNATKRREAECHCAGSSASWSGYSFILGREKSVGVRESCVDQSQYLSDRVLHIPFAVEKPNLANSDSSSSVADSVSSFGDPKQNQWIAADPRWAVEMLLRFWQCCRRRRWTVSSPERGVVRPSSFSRASLFVIQQLLCQQAKMCLYRGG